MSEAVFPTQIDLDRLVERVPWEVKLVAHGHKECEEALAEGWEPMNMFLGLIRTTMGDMPGVCVGLRRRKPVVEGA